MTKDDKNETAVRRFSFSASWGWGGVCSNLKTVCRVLAIAALLQGWLCVGVLCALQMCCNVQWAVRDFELKVLSLEGKRNFQIGLRTTVQGFALPGIEKRLPGELKLNSEMKLMINCHAERCSSCPDCCCTMICC